MSRTTKIMEAAEQQRLTEAFDAIVRSHLQPREQVRAWVFGRTWPNEVVQLATMGVSGQGALGGGLYGYMIDKHTTARFVIVTDRRVICLIEGAPGSILEWEARRDEVTTVDLTRRLSGRLLVLQHGVAEKETRIHISSAARKQAQSLVSLLTQE